MTCSPHVLASYFLNKVVFSNITKEDIETLSKDDLDLLKEYIICEKIVELAPLFRKIPLDKKEFGTNNSILNYTNMLSASDAMGVFRKVPIDQFQKLVSEVISKVRNGEITTNHFWDLLKVSVSRLSRKKLTVLITSNRNQEAYIGKFIMLEMFKKEAVSKLTILGERNVQRFIARNGITFDDVEDETKSAVSAKVLISKLKGVDIGGTSNEAKRRVKRMLSTWEDKQ